METAKGRPAALTQDQVTAMARLGGAEPAVTRILEAQSSRRPLLPAARGVAAKQRPGAASPGEAARLEDGKGRAKSKAEPVRGARPDKRPPGAG
jgi:hypothetical protein